MQVKRLLSNTLRFLLFFGIGATILYLLYRGEAANYQLYCDAEGIPEEECSLLAKIWNDFQNANYSWILLVLLAYIISNISRMMRWFMLIRPLGYSPRRINGFFTIMLGYFANLGFPRIGEVVRAGTFARYEKIPVEKVMGTVVVDRIADMFSLLVILSLAFLLEFDTLWNYITSNSEQGEQSLLASPLVIGGLIFLLVAGSLLYFFRKIITKSRFYKKVVDVLKGFWEGIQTIRQLDRPGWFIAHSINIWLMYYLMTYMAFFAYAPTADLSPVVGLMVFVFGTLGIIVPSPGGMGAYQGLVTAALLLYGIQREDAFSFANILFFSIQIGANVLLGIIALIILPIVNKNYTPQAVENPQA